MRSYLTEFIGTFFLVLTIGLTVLGGTPFAPLAIGASLMIMVFMGGHISGAHYNPAVSVACAMRKKLPWSEVAPYVAAQLLGAMAAAFTVYGLLDQTFTLAPAEGFSATRAVVVEALYTFALALVVLNVATIQKTKGNSFYGLAIGFTIVVAAFAGGPLSGGAFNPAVGFGPILVHSILGDGTLGTLWIYFVGPLLGAVVAAAAFAVQGEE
ncbi:MAG TPA: aquaporin [Gemmatimonadales bacterium]|jgi:aquaporin Z|nr:aquaporin [Gemmatimonadales bacterium]